MISDVDPSLAWLDRAVANIARETADKAAGWWSVCGEPIVFTQAMGDRVAFVFDYMLLYGAQSGSDSYEHHVFSGTAMIDGEHLRDVQMTERLNYGLSEHAVEWATPRYDRKEETLRVATSEFAGGYPKPGR
jgi:hypothetical protein